MVKTAQVDDALVGAINALTLIREALRTAGAAAEDLSAAIDDLLRDEDAARE